MIKLVTQARKEMIRNDKVVQYKDVVIDAENIVSRSFAGIG
jgi:hypothetical protein